MKQGVAEKEHACSASLVNVKTGGKTEATVDKSKKQFLALINTQAKTNRSNCMCRNCSITNTSDDPTNADRLTMCF